ncbi:PepSY domain-containing protein [Pseudonocardia adelaidensis]|uniref:PepSY domain-containing protein n=1 Tax=Pseudonocardia adelaidensis TaxID=648754 RepID=A0ABP9NPY7_9PSEU
MRNRPVVLAVTGVTALLATGAGIALASAPETVQPAAFSAPTTPPTPDLATASPAGTTGELSSAEAADIALRHVGGGRVTEIEREFEHGRREWKVEIIHAGREHDVRVDAATGAVTRTDVGRDD